MISKNTRIDKIGNTLWIMWMGTGGLATGGRPVFRGKIHLHTGAERTTFCGKWTSDLQVRTKWVDLPAEARSVDKYCKTCLDMAVKDKLAIVVEQPDFEGAAIGSSLPCQYRGRKPATSNMDAFDDRYGKRCNEPGTHLRVTYDRNGQQVLEISCAQHDPKHTRGRVFIMDRDLGLSPEQLPVHLLYQYRNHMDNAKSVAELDVIKLTEQLRKAREIVKLSTSRYDEADALYIEKLSETAQPVESEEVV